MTRDECLALAVNAGFEQGDRCVTFGGFICDEEVVKLVELVSDRLEQSWLSTSTYEMLMRERKETLSELSKYKKDFEDAINELNYLRTLQKSLFDAHDKSLDGHHVESREAILYVANVLSGDVLPENY